MPTVDAAGRHRPENVVRRLVQDAVVRSPRVGSSPSAFAVGVLRGYPVQATRPALDASDKDAAHWQRQA